MPILRPAAVAALALAAALTAAHAQPAPTPSPPPSAAQPAAPSTEQTDPFGEPFTMTARTMIVRKGTANWDSAFDTLIDAFKAVTDYMAKEGIAPAGPATTIYLSTDDTGFQFEAGYPIAEAPKNPPTGDLAVTRSPDGKALKFVHRGSYDSMDSTYEAITNHLDEKQLDARDSFIEEYAVNPVTTPEDQLVIDVLVPIK